MHKFDVTWFIFIAHYFYLEVNSWLLSDLKLFSCKSNHNRKTGSKACKTPLNFLTVKLLWHIQILWKQWNLWGKPIWWIRDKSSVVRVVRYLGLVVVKKNSVVSVVRHFILKVVKKNSVVNVVSEVKQLSERSQRFHFSISEMKQRSECSQIFHFNSSEERQRSEHSQWSKTA